MFAEGDLFGTIPATFEILCSGFQSDAHLSPRLGEDPTKAFFLPWNDLSGVESASYDPWKQRCLLYSWYFSSCFLPSCSSRVGDTALGCIELKMVLLTPYLVRRVRKSSILFKSVSPCLSLERTSGQDSQSSKRVFLFLWCSKNRQRTEQRKTGLLHSVATPCSPPARIPGKGWDLRSPSPVCIQEPLSGRSETVLKWPLLKRLVSCSVSQHLFLHMLKTSRII